MRRREYPGAPSAVNNSKPSHLTTNGQTAVERGLNSRHPRFWDAVIADARITAAARGERHAFRSRLDGGFQVLRLMLQTDAFLALAAYRAKARLKAIGIPVLPSIAHRIAMMSAQISIADSVVVHPGVSIPNGQVVVYGVAEIEPFVTLLPWVTVGTVGGGFIGPTIRARAQIGTGAKVLGEVEVGESARVGTNAVVLDDVPPGTTVVGMPAAPITERGQPLPPQMPAARDAPVAQPPELASPAEPIAPPPAPTPAETATEAETATNVPLTETGSPAEAPTDVEAEVLAEEVRGEEATIDGQEAAAPPATEPKRKT